jgi:AhpD family alkylhydroperoxidase
MVRCNPTPALLHPGWTAPGPGWQKPWQMVGSIAEMEWGTCWLDPVTVPAALAAQVRRSTGGLLPAWATRLATVPWVVRAFAGLSAEPVAHLPPRLAALINLVVSQDNSCRYCYGATRALLKIQGFTDAAIARMERDLHLADLAPAEVAALQFARTVSQANPRPTAGDLAALERAGFARAAVAEIAGIAAFAGFCNRISTLFALPPERFERWVDHPLARLVRPLVARRLAIKRVAPVPPPPNDGPCADVVAALADAPLAPTVRGIIDDAMASAILPRRMKLLILAVIGRALGCDLAEGEARSGLASDGLAPADVDHILRNLGSPKLDDRESRLLPWARETVRYRALAIQERTRELARHMTVPEVIEAVGIASLANAVARLAILVETC